MPLDSPSILFAQHELAAHRYTGPTDGLLNTAMGTALAGVPGIAASWPLARKVVAFIQQRIGLTGRDVDGLWGDQTQTTYDTHQYRLAHGTSPAPWRPEDRDAGNPNYWPRQGSRDADLTLHFGAPSSRLVSLTPPYPHFLAWATDQPMRTIRCHIMVRDSLERVLTNVLRIYGNAEISRLRHSSALAHAWRRCQPAPCTKGVVSVGKGVIIGGASELERQQTIVNVPAFCPRRRNGIMPKRALV